MTEQEIERCLGRFTIGKATDVMNFDYSGTLAYLQRLKAENDELKEAEHRAEVAERALELMERGECTFASPEYYKKQAKKELSEERKDD